MNSTVFEMIIRVFGAFLSIYSFAVLLQVPRRFVLQAGIVGAIGGFVYLLAIHFGRGDLMASLYSAVAAAVVSSLIFHQEKLDQKKVLGCIVGFAGVVLINLSGSNVDMSFNLTGDGFIFISAIAYALSSVLIKKYSAKSDPVMLSGYQFTAGGLVMILIGFVMGGRIHTASMPAMILLIYMALISDRKSVV